MNRPPDILRRGGHGDVANAELAERVDDRVDDRGGRGRGRAFASGLDAERIGRREDLDDLRAEGRHGVRPRQRVVHQRAGERLSGGGVDVVNLRYRLADPLSGAAVRLAVDDQRVDAASDVVDRGESGDLDRARFGIDLALADRASVREDRVVHLVVGDDGEPARQLPRQEGPLRVPRQFREAERPERVRRREAPVGESDLRRARLLHVGYDLLPLFDQFFGGYGEHGRGVSHRAAGMRTAAHAHDVGVAEEDVDRVHGHVKERGHYLREARLVTLARGLRTDHDLDSPCWRDGDFGALPGRADRGLDVVRQTEPEELAARGGPAAARLEPAPVRDLHRSIHVGLVGAAVVGHPHRVPVRHRLGANQVLSSQLDPVEPELFRGRVDQALDGEVDLGAARAAVGIGGRGRGEDGAASERGRGNVVAAGDESRSFRERRQRHAARADVGEVGGAHRQELPVFP